MVRARASLEWRRYGSTDCAPRSAPEYYARLGPGYATDPSFVEDSIATVLRLDDERAYPDLA